MAYRFATERRDYSDLAAGRVLRVLPGFPALPVRLADEVFQRCVALRGRAGPQGRLVLYDPCCGGAYHLSVLGLLHAGLLHKVIGSDVDPEAVRVAGQNLELLSVDGLAQRAQALERLAAQFGRPSHHDALASALGLRAGLERALGGRQLERELFVADALSGPALRERLGGQRVDLVVTDVPYGSLAQWRSDPAREEGREPIWALLDALGEVLEPGGVVGVVADKRQKAAHPAFRRAEQFQVGRRRVGIFVRSAG